MIQIADIIADLLLSAIPYSIDSRKGSAQRAKIDFKVLEEAKIKVRKLAESAGKDIDVSNHGYPHFYYLDDKIGGNTKKTAYDLLGKNLLQFINYAFSSDLSQLNETENQNTIFLLTVKQSKVFSHA